MEQFRSRGRVEAQTLLAGAVTTPFSMNFEVYTLNANGTAPETDDEPGDRLVARG